MWVARDQNGELWAFIHKPQRLQVSWFSIGNTYQKKIDDESLFPNLKWEDEPIEVDDHFVLTLLLGNKK